jgi:hypothetical protein
MGVGESQIIEFSRRSVETTARTRTISCQKANASPKKALVLYTSVLEFPLLVLVSCFATHPMLCQALLSFGLSILLIWCSSRHSECKHKAAADAQNAQRLSLLFRYLVAYRVCEIKGNNFRSPWPSGQWAFEWHIGQGDKVLVPCRLFLAWLSSKDLDPLLCPTITLLPPVAAAFDKDLMDCSLICSISLVAGSVESGLVDVVISA